MVDCQASTRGARGARAQTVRVTCVFHAALSSRHAPPPICALLKARASMPPPPAPPKYRSSYPLSYCSPGAPAGCPPPSSTNWTRLVPLPVLTGRVSSVNAPPSAARTEREPRAATGQCGAPAPRAPARAPTSCTRRRARQTGRAFRKGSNGFGALRGLQTTRSGIAARARLGKARGSAGEWGVGGCDWLAHVSHSPYKVDHRYRSSQAAHTSSAWGRHARAMLISWPARAGAGAGAVRRGQNEQAADGTWQGRAQELSGGGL
jgi:hypothetical protein